MPPPFPAHLRHYLPDVMRLGPLSPNELWNTDVIDLELGKAVQNAWHEGIEAAKAGHNAEAQATEAMAERYGGRAQC